MKYINLVINYMHSTGIGTKECCCCLMLLLFRNDAIAWWFCILFFPTAAVAWTCSYVLFPTSAAAAFCCFLLLQLLRSAGTGVWALGVTLRASSNRTGLNLSSRLMSPNKEAVE